MKTQIVRDGAVAGMLGALTVAIWFLIFDISGGTPFQTPALLATALFHPFGAHPATLVAAAEYSVVHLMAFVAFGISASILVEAAERNRSLLPPLVMIMAIFEVAFVVLVMLLGHALPGSLSWWSVLVGNLLATAAMLGYFFNRHPDLVRHLFGPWIVVWSEGASAGMIGAAVVILWFLLHDLGSGANPFRTPAMLAGALLQGASNPATIAVSSPLVLGYTVLHFAVFIAFGVIASSLAASLDEVALWTALLLLICVFQAFFVGFSPLLSGVLDNQLSPTAIAAGNLFSSIALLGFIYMRRTTLHLRLANPEAAAQA
jgi:hypothetical protein